MTRIRNMSEEELEKDIDESLNWDVLAKRHVRLSSTPITHNIRFLVVPVLTAKFAGLMSMTQISTKHHGLMTRIKWYLH